MKIKSLRIQDIQFSPRETARLLVRARNTLMERDSIGKENARKKIKLLTGANILRLALGSEFTLRNRGGSRPNAGRPKEAKEQKPE